MTVDRVLCHGNGEHFENGLLHLIGAEEHVGFWIGPVLGHPGRTQKALNDNRCIGRNIEIDRLAPGDLSFVACYGFEQLQLPPLFMGIGVIRTPFVGGKV